MTGPERRGEIDRQFDETFAVFDERMRKEQEAISRERAGRAGTAAETGDDTEGEADAPGEGAETSDDGTGAPAGEGETTGTNGTGDEPGSAGAGSEEGERTGGGGVGGGGPKGGSGPSGVPSDIPDGSDDDIVARQLREAAMKETDPELRERLWDEYRTYKQSTQ